MEKETKRKSGREAKVDRGRKRGSEREGEGRK